MSEKNPSNESLEFCEAPLSQQECATAKAPNSVCAIIVAYFPDKEFDRRIRSLFHQVTQVVIVNNTPEGSGLLHLKETLLDDVQVCVIENRENVGISFALNQGLKHALALGFKWILTLDQDTDCYPDMVETLLTVAESCESKPAVIGGNYVDSRNKEPMIPVGKAEGFLEQKTVITSGSLIDASKAEAIGGFRDDYFIDQVDHEFCLRARSHGHKVVVSCKPVMSHCVGSPGGIRLPFLGVLPSHSPLRKYYISRNSIVTIAAYWRQDPEWCLRRLVRLILGLGYMTILEQNRLKKVRAFFAGISDSIFRRMGPCQRKWLL